MSEREREEERGRERGGREKYKVYRRGTCIERGLIFWVLFFGIQYINIHQIKIIDFQ